MTLLADLKERRRLAQARVQPHLWFTHFSVPEILERVLDLADCQELLPGTAKDVEEVNW